MNELNFSDYRDLVRTDIFSFMDEGPLFNWVDVNPTELCNRTCSFCPRGVDYPNKNFHITEELIEKIGIDLEEVDFGGIVNICGNGEPLLSKNLFSLIERLKHFTLEIVTNGDKLTEKKIEKLYNSGLDNINVSLYDGEFQIDYFNNLFQGVGISTDRYTLREYWKPLPFLNNRAGSIDVGTPFIDRPCYYMHYSIQIDWNGDVLFCLQSIYNKSIIHGNILTSSMKDIWYGESMNSYRTLLKNGRNHSPCSSCNVNGIRFGEKYVYGWSDE